MRVVVLTRAVVDLAAGMAAFDLDRRMADPESVTQSCFELANRMLCIAQRALFADDDMTAQRNLI